ncbi:hypothetical protein ACFO1B_13110 [Dactylosporangium siamense]|uniref:Uncharacterized protein n=1 Tax=Dactylosporangium siamense TaxID=685454 RepID=A0A919UEM9_9ACTN|nr:hypothetical protein [Dactylosporangium siamense]GIG49226.1 hypothetical protein Dsi01nite_072670 [Dactylosporangium siamense]
MKAAIIILVPIILAVLVDGWLRQRRRAAPARGADFERFENGRQVTA